EKVTVDVAVEITGEAAPETMVSLESNTVALEAEATNIPTSIEVSVEGAEAGHQVLAADLVLPEGSALAVDPETLVVNVTTAQLADLETEEEGEGEDAEGAEGEADEAESNDDE